MVSVISLGFIPFFDRFYRCRLMECGDSSPLWPGGKSAAIGTNRCHTESSRVGCWLIRLFRILLVRTGWFSVASSTAASYRDGQSGDESPQSKIGQSGDKSPQSKVPALQNRCTPKHEKELSIKVAARLSARRHSAKRQLPVAVDCLLVSIAVAVQCGPQVRRCGAGP